MIDTHCHLNFPDLLEDLDQVIADARDAGVDRMITVGTTLDDAPQLAEITARYERVWYTVGLHPHQAAHWAGRLDELQAGLREGLAREGCVAAGEMGMDFHYGDPSATDQRACFAAQLEVAKEVDLPIVIHNRKATDVTLEVIAESGLPGDRFVFHCFTGEAEELDRILSIGATVGFTGIVTFRSAKALAEASDRVPLDRLLIETDSPYLTPEPHRKVRPNEPRYVVHVAAFLAARRGMSEGDFVAAVDGNARRVFGV